MRGKYKGLILILLLTISSVSATNLIITPTIEAYCAHRGYTVEINEDENGNIISAFCVFSSTDTNLTNKCDLFEFYSNKCDSKYLTEIGCRGEGQVVFTSFETCCQDLASINENSVIDLPTCTKPSLWQQFLNFLKSRGLLRNS